MVPTYSSVPIQIFRTLHCCNGRRNDKCVCVRAIIHDIMHMHIIVLYGWYDARPRTSRNAGLQFVNFYYSGFILRMCTQRVHILLTDFSNVYIWAIYRMLFIAIIYYKQLNACVNYIMVFEMSTARAKEKERIK